MPIVVCDRDGQGAAVAEDGAGDTVERGGQGVAYRYARRYSRRDRAAFAIRHVAVEQLDGDLARLRALLPQPDPVVRNGC